MGRCRFGRWQREAADEIARIGIGDGQRVAVLSVTGLEVSLVISTPELVGGGGDGGRLARVLERDGCACFFGAARPILMRASDCRGSLRDPTPDRGAISDNDAHQKRVLVRRNKNPSNWLSER